MAIPLPPLSFAASSAASSKLDQMGNAWDFGGGDWIVNVAGSGKSAQSASGSSMLPWIVAGIVGALWATR